MRAFRRSCLVGLALSLGSAPTACSGAGATTETDDDATAASEASATSSASDGSSGGGSDGETTGAPACDGPWEHGVAIELPTLPPGDPAAGREALLTEDYVSCGIPWNLFAIAGDALGGETPLPGREGKNALVGHAWNVIEKGDGSELVVSNCLQCHAGEFNGELIIGLGKTTHDATGANEAALAALADLPETSEANILFNKFKARVLSLSEHSLMKTVGANPAVMYALSLLAHRDPDTLEWIDEPTYALDPDKLLPADPPPWWRVRKKASHFANGMSRGDHRGTMILASSLCTDSVAEAEEMLTYFADIQAYLATLEPPPYPFAIDAALAAEGEAIFECTCAGCHGTYDADPAAESYPNLLIPTEIIGTDPQFATYAAEGGPYNFLEAWFNESFYGGVSTVVTSDPAPGYTAPPLDGVWATAPYLHNGSVPSIALLLESAARPTYWRRVDYDSTHYDEAALGWPWVESASQADTPASERKYVYDTTFFGYSNSGHTFGDHLDDHERAAVLEYLKTL